MSSFNTVRFSCPNCGANIEYQSKAGSCSMKEFTLGDIEMQELAELNVYGAECPSCHEIAFADLQVAIRMYSEPKETETTH